MIPAGPLDRRITIRRPVWTAGATGEPVTTYENVAIVWAHKRETTGRERLEAGQVSADLDATFTIRWLPDQLDATMQIVEGDRTYNINRIVELPGRRVGYELLAKALDRTGAAVAA